MRYITNDKWNSFHRLKDSNDVAAVLEMLYGLGFVLQGVLTNGEHSSHDGTYSFSSTYATYAEFAAQAHHDFAEQTERYKSAAVVDWSYTRFVLSSPADWDVCLFMRKEAECHDCPDTAYLSLEKTSPTAEDAVLAESWLAAVECYLAK